MADEATIRSSLQIVKGDLNYQSQPTTFQADVSTAKGPTPGAVLATTAGTDVDLSALTTPGLARFQNLDASNYVEVGTWDPENLLFYPLLELLPGEVQVVRIARNLSQEVGTGPGTGTAGPSTNKLRVRANAAACNVFVEIFEK